MAERVYTRCGPEFMVVMVNNVKVRKQVNWLSYAKLIKGWVAIMCQVVAQALSIHPQGV